MVTHVSVLRPQSEESVWKKNSEKNSRENLLFTVYYYFTGVSKHRRDHPQIMPLHVSNRALLYLLPMRQSPRTRCHGARASNPTRNTPPARSAPCSIEPAPLPPARPPIHPTSHGAQATTATTAAAPRARRASARCHACAGRLLRAGRVVPRALPPLILPLLPPSGAACTLERARRRLGQLGLVTLFIPPFPQHRLGSAQPLQG